MSNNVFSNLTDFDAYRDIFPAQIVSSTLVSGIWYYEWIEQTFLDDGTFEDAISPRAGIINQDDGQRFSPAVELNNNQVPCPKYVWLKLRGSVGGTPLYEFQSDVCSVDPDRKYCIPYVCPTCLSCSGGSISITPKYLCYDPADCGWQSLAAVQLYPCYTLADDETTHIPTNIPPQLLCEVATATCSCPDESHYFLLTSTDTSTWTGTVSVCGDVYTLTLALNGDMTSLDLTVVMTCDDCTTDEDCTRVENQPTWTCDPFAADFTLEDGCACLSGTVTFTISVGNVAS